MSKVITVDHPLVQHKLTRCRDKEKKPWEFRSLVEEIACRCPDLRNRLA